MRKMNLKRSFSATFLTVLLLNIILAGCKKDLPADPESQPTGTPVVSGKIETPIDNAPTTGTRDELTRDSIFLYARQIYLWWDDVPDYGTFKPRNYSSFSNEIYAITRFGTNPATGKPYEFSADVDGSDSNDPKYSYFTDVTDKNPLAYIPGKKSSVDLLGNGFDFGLLVRPYGSSSSYTIYVQAVYPSSPAEKAGFKRGDRFDIINDKKIGTNYSGEYSFFYNALFNSSAVKLQGTTSAGTSFSRSLNRASYKSSPIYKDSVYTSGDKKIGYLAYARFSDYDNSVPEFTRVFNKFAQSGITDLIVDLRYNGGGYVNTAEYLINYIAPSSLNGKVMYTEYYNELMQADKATILKKQPLLDANDKPRYQNGRLVTYADVDYSVAENTNHFAKKGSVNTIKNVVFIVSESTASASELVINSLKPYMNVKIVGSTTYGKPVGFFPVRIDKYDVYFSMFETRNSKNEGGYFAGFVPDTQDPKAITDNPTDNDNPNYDFGDLRERSFLAAYNYLTKGSFTAQAGSASVLAQKMQVLTLGDKDLGDTEFKGMIQEPHRLKLKF